jgi:hypothetical protein
MKRKRQTPMAKRQTNPEERCFQGFGSIFAVSLAFGVWRLGFLGEVDP